MSGGMRCSIGYCIGPLREAKGYRPAHRAAWCSSWCSEKAGPWKLPAVAPRGMIPGRAPGFILVCFDEGVRKPPELWLDYCWLLGASVRWEDEYP
jgi:hypothetical protein